MIIGHNLPFITAERNFKINTDNKAKSTKKLSSGFKINSAADDAAGLSISEKLREQIRGLDKGTTNATDGISWLQTGDGALNEVHAIMHRMKELTVQALNDTNTEADKAALQMEFDSLQSEIDRITGTTQFNTKNIFSEHEPTYHQLEGNVAWQQNQRHVVDAGENTFTINYIDADGITEVTGTVSVPEGVYTTQELIDELDDAMRNSGLADKGLNIEYTKDGTCNVNYEGGLDITGIDGGLSYLINDTYNGGSVGALIGTTVFADGGRLDISTGNNDNLSFQILDFSGGSKTVDITLPAGRYNRDQIITMLNDKLSGTDVKAVKKGTGIKLETDSAIITGFKGNMFKIDVSDDKSKIYTSVFYDNIMYGNTTATPAVFTGGAVLNTSASDLKYNKFRIDSGNNSLTLSANGGSKVTLTIPDGEYSASEMCSRLNSLFADNGLNIKADYIYSGGFNGLTITSGIKGLESKIEIDSSSSAYGTLFTDCDYTTFYSGATLVNEYSNDSTPYIISGKTFSADKLPIVITAGVNDSFKLDLSGNTYDISIQPGAYTSAADLASAMDMALNGSSASLGYKDKVAVSLSSNRITITGKEGSGLTNIGVSATGSNQGYRDIFIGEDVRSVIKTASDYGTSTTPATITTNTDIPDSINFDSSNNKITITQNGVNRTVTFPTGPASHDDIVNTINDQLKDQVSVYSNTFSTINVTGSTSYTNVIASANGTTSVSSKTYHNVGTATKKQGSTEKKEDIPAKVTMEVPLGATTVISGDNNTLRLSLNTSAATPTTLAKTENIVLDNGSYTAEQLRAEIQKKINAAFGSGEGSVDVTLSGNKLVFTSKLGASVDGDQTSIDFDTSSSSFIKELHTTRTQASALSSQALADSIVIDGTNNGFKFTYRDPATGNNTVNLKLASGTYTRDSFVAELNKKLGAAGVAVTASNSGGKLLLKTNNAGNGYGISYQTSDGGSSAGSIFGNLRYDSTVAATADQNTQDSIVIDGSTNGFNIKVDGVDYNLTLDNGTYTRSGFVSMLNKKLADSNAGLTVSLDGNKLRYTATNKGSGASLYMTYASGGSSMERIYGKTTVTTPGVTASFDGDKLKLTGNSNGGSLSVSSANSNIFQTSEIQKSDINPTVKSGYISSIHSKMDGVNLSEPVVIDAWNKKLSFVYTKEGGSRTVDFTLPEKSYTFTELKKALQDEIDADVGAGELEVSVDSTGVVIKAVGTGSKYRLSSFSGSFYDKVLNTYTENHRTYEVRNTDGTQLVEPAFAIGRKDIKSEVTEIEKNLNDSFEFDVNYGSTKKTVSIKITPGKYSGDALAKEIQTQVNKSLVAQGLPEGMLEIGVGGVSTGVIGANDDKALCIKLSNKVALPYQGEYIIDGVRGEAAFYIFYQSDGKMVPAYTAGSKDLTEGTTITADNNKLSFDVDGVNYELTLAEGEYSAQEMIDEINNKLKAGSVPVTAKLEDNHIKLSYEKLGKHTINNIKGSAKQDIFFQENGAEGDNDDILLQLSGKASDGSGLTDANNVAQGRDYMIIDRPVLNTVSLGLNSLTISKNKYANKALARLDEALDMVSSVRSQMGAEQNRLEHVIRSNENNSENTSASDSRLRDTDMAAEMVENSKANILQQAGFSVMSQANSLKEGVLKLLQ